MDKSRVEQEQDFKTYAEPYANPSCMICFGRGYSGWHIEFNSLILCQCVQKNLLKAKEAQKKKIEIVS